MADQMESPHTDETAIKGRSRRRRLRLVLMLALAVVFVGVGLAYAAYWYGFARFSVVTDDAYVHGNRVQLMSQVAGTVTAVDADDTDLVEQSQPLVELDRSDLKLALQKAQANLAQTVRDVRQLYAQQAQQAAIVDQRNADLGQARRDYRRYKRLVQAHSVSEQQFQHAKTTWRKAQAGQRESEHKLAELRAVTAGTTLATHPRVALAAAALGRAYLDLQRTEVQAPVTGYVANRSVQVGQQVTTGQPLLAVVPLNQVWVQANFKETDLGAMRIGQPVDVVSDYYGDSVHYHGRVAGVSAGTGSAFELLPPQNATGNWIKVVQRVPVRITLPEKELKAHPLRLGLSMRVSVDISDGSGRQLAQVARTRPRYQTAVYSRQSQGVKALIQRIITTNAGAGGANLGPGGVGRHGG